MMYLLKIREVRNKGVLLTVVSEDGKLKHLEFEFTPHFYAINLPPRYLKDNRKAVIENVNLKPWVGYTSKPQKVLKFTTHKRSLPTWSSVYEVKTPILRQFMEHHDIRPGCFTDNLGILKQVDLNDIPNPLITSFDIECYSKSRAFPDAVTAAPNCLCPSALLP